MLAEGCAEQLASRGLAVEDLAGHAREIADDECLLLVGSIAEGLANADSDVDLLLIGRRSGFSSFGISRMHFEVETVRLSDAVEISIETFEPAHLSRYEDTMRSIAELFEAPATAESMPLLASEEEIKLLHRIRNGVPLANPEVVDDWRRRLHLDVLPEAVALGAGSAHFVHREDGISHALEGDFDTATICLRDSASDAAALLLASVGQTHPSARWRLRLLRRCDGELGEDRVEAIAAAMLDRVATRADIERLISLFDEAIIEAAARLPRVAEVATRLATVFPVHSHLDDDQIAFHSSP